MKLFAILLLSILLTGCSDGAPERIVTSVPHPDQDRLHEAIRLQATDAQEKALNSDWAGFIPYVHPVVVMMAGGPEKLREQLEAGRAAIQTIESYAFGEISDVVPDGGRLTAFLTVETIYRYPTVRARQKAYQIACSDDEGKSWTFLDYSSKEQEAFLKGHFPTLTQKIPFPPCEHQRL